VTYHAKKEMNEDGLIIKRKNLLVIEDIPMVSYPNWEERYFTEETLHEIEGIKHTPMFSKSLS
jgi:hypothetical protein